MTLAEKILEELRALPEASQAEVLDFVEYIAAKVAAPDKGGEAGNWGTFSLTNAVRGMEDEPSPYSLADVKESV